MKWKAIISALNPVTALLWPWIFAHIDFHYRFNHLFPENKENGMNEFCLKIAIETYPHPPNPHPDQTEFLLWFIGRSFTVCHDLCLKQALAFQVIWRYNKYIITLASKRLPIRLTLVPLIVFTLLNIALGYMTAPTVYRYEVFCYYRCFCHLLENVCCLVMITFGSLHTLLLTVRLLNRCQINEYDKLN